MHAVLEFERGRPPYPEDVRYRSPEVVSLCGDERFDLDLPDSTDAWDAYFEQPLCHTCRLPTSPRSNRALCLLESDTNYDGGFIDRGPWSARIFSASFRRLLTDEEQGRLKFQTVVLKTPSRQAYYELIGPTGPPRVAIADAKPTGWRCAACGSSCFRYHRPGSRLHQFVSDNDLPQPLSEVFAIGTPGQIELCMLASRWQAMIGKPGARGIVSTPIGVADQCQVVKEVALATKRR
jgi:hypothetical protein